MSSPRARQLRSTPTDAEHRLWSSLRRKQLDRFRFRRQQPIGALVGDFFRAPAKLIVEVDGGPHAEQRLQRAARTRWLEEGGHRVLRFWNNDVLSNTEGVVLAILEALRGCPPSPTLPLKGGGGILRQCVGTTCLSGRISEAS